MSAENVGEMRIELLFDATGSFLEFRTRLVERQPYPAKLPLDFMGFDPVGIPATFKPVTHNPGATHPQTRCNAQAG